MSLAEALTAARPPMTTGPRCSIAVLLDRLDPKDAAALVAALEAAPAKVTP